MPTRKASHMMLGMMHRNRPIWDFGCMLYWRAMRGDRIQNPGGVYVNGDPEFTFTHGGTTRYTYFDPGRGFYREVDPNVDPAVLPLDGHFVPTRVQQWNTSHAINDRRFLGIGAGLTVVLGGPPVEWILFEDHPPGPPSFPHDTFRVQNSTGSSKRIWQIQGSGTPSATNNHMWSVLVRRSDNGVIDATTLNVGACDSALPETDPDLSFGLTFRKIRDDGWYQVSTILGPQAGSPARTFFVELEDGANVFVEAPQIEQFSTAAGTLQEPTPPITTLSGSDAQRATHALEVPTTGGFDLPPNGWMGCTVIPRTDTPSPAGPVGAIVEWRIDSSNRQRFLFSNSFNAVAFQTQVGGVSQAFLQLQPSDTQQGVPMGLCATWGKRDGSTYFYLCFNGKQVELDTSGTVPTGGPTQLMIGSQFGPSASPVKLVEFAVGDVNLSRHDCRLLSRWFQDRGFSSLDVAGA